MQYLINIKDDSQNYSKVPDLQSKKVNLPSSNDNKSLLHFNCYLINSSLKQSPQEFPQWTKPLPKSNPSPQKKKCTCTAKRKQAW